MDVSSFFYFVASFPDLSPLHRVEPFLSKLLKYFIKIFCTIQSDVFFHKIILEIIEVHLFSLIFWNFNMHWRVWIVILLDTSLLNIFITFFIRRIFTSIKGGNISYIFLIKTFIIFNIFYIKEMSWLPITIIPLIEPILYFLQILKCPLLILIGTFNTGGIFSFYVVLYALFC